MIYAKFNDNFLLCTFNLYPATSTIAIQEDCILIIIGKCTYNHDEISYNKHSKWPDKY